jgi:ATP-dependent protease ClpP protease subunit
VKKINVRGVVIPNDDAWIYDLFDVEHTTPNMIIDSLEQANGDDVEVVINSGGGDVFAGSDIWTSLKEYQGNVTTKVVGIAASIASVIAMAGDKVKISPTAQIMIHNVWSMAMGDYRDLQHESDMLKNYNKTISNAYRIKTGLEESELLDMMDNETWLTAQDSKEKGFADEIMFENNQPQLVATMANGMIPQKVIDTVRNMKSEFVKEEPTHEKSDFLWARLNLLKLKGDGNE